MFIRPTLTLTYIYQANFQVYLNWKYVKYRPIFQIQKNVKLVRRSMFEEEKKNLRTLPVDHKCNSFILDTEQILKLHFTKMRSAQVGIFK